MIKTNSSHPIPKRRGLWRTAAGLIALSALLLGLGDGICGDTPVLPEYQVKALFLLNFTKYVDWPPEAFAATNSPILIGVIGNSGINDELKKVVETKTVNGRKILLQQIAAEKDWGPCHIIFISSSEKTRQVEILNKLKTLPVLTVGETGSFLQDGGIINFTKKEDRIRLEINLDAARQAKVQISSKLLSVADLVKGKPN